MDQLKKFFAQAKRNLFWILIGAAVLFGLVGWYFTKTNLDKLYADQVQAIRGKYSAIEQVRSKVGTHPNESSQAEMDKIIQSLELDVQKAWDEQYQRQTAYMKWPEIGVPTLIEKLKGFYPIEQKLTFPEDPPGITESDRTRFSRYFDEQMPKLAEIIGVRWVGTSEGLASSGGGSQGSDGGRPGGNLGQSGNLSHNSDDVVIWQQANQDQRLKTLRLWRGDKPDVYQMIYTQENIWILEGLLNIIAKTNIVPQTGNPASANVQASIKEIEFIRIGRAAIGSAGIVANLESSGGGGGLAGGLMSGGGSGRGGIAPPTESGASDEEGSGDGSIGLDESSAMIGAPVKGGGDASQSEAPVRYDPADRRYVDASFKPILGADLRSKIKSESPEDAYFAVAKRVPVRLRMTMDMRRLQTFLANCGNEGLMLEVRQVRIGDLEAVTGSGGDRSSAPSLGGKGGGPKGGPGGLMGGGGGGRGAGSGLEELQGKGRRNPNEMKVEIYGTVYLFYPVDIERLGLDKVEEDFKLQETVEDSTDATPTPWPAAPATSEPAVGGDVTSDASPEAATVVPDESATPPTDAPSTPPDDSSGNPPVEGSTD